MEGVRNKIWSGVGNGRTVYKLSVIIIILRYDNGSECISGW